MCKEIRLDDMPSIINLEVFRGECPCKCVHCPVGIENVEDRKRVFGIKHMKMELFSKICDELAEKNVSTIRLHSVGEPLLWCNLIDAINYADAKGILTWLFTSLVTNDDVLLMELCNKVSIIEVSINSVERGDYFNTKGIDAYELVKRNLEFMSRYIQSNGLKTRLIVSRVQSEDMLCDKYFVDYWKKTGLVSDAFVRTYHTYNNLLEKKASVDMYKEPCSVHWKRFNISVDGHAVVCFNELFKNDITEECILGNICNETIHDIWHGKKMELIRLADLQNNYSRYLFSDKFPCKNCLNCQGGEGRVTSEHQIEQMRENSKRERR